MHVGLVMECDYRYGETEQAAFDEAFAMADAAEMGGLDGVWLAERHFAAPRSPLDTGGAGIPSVVSAPLIISSAIVARYQRLRVGVAVNVLPLAHPIRLAEEVATVDHISRGRVEFGVGRSGFARAYEGYGISYAESRERFQESLDVILSAWTNDRFLLRGQVLPVQRRVRYPQAVPETLPAPAHRRYDQGDFPAGGPARSARVRRSARDGPADAGRQPGRVPRRLGKPLGTGVTPASFCVSPCTWARLTSRPTPTPRNPTMRSYRRLAQNFLNSATVAGATPSEERVQRGHQLSAIGYEDLLRDRLAYGSPETVTRLLREIIEEQGLSGVVAEVNVGGGIAKDKVLASVKRFATEVAPALR